MLSSSRPRTSTYGMSYISLYITGILGFDREVLTPFCSCRPQLWSMALAALDAHDLPAIQRDICLPIPMRKSLI